MVIRKRAVDLAEHLGDITAHSPVERRGERTGDAVAAVHRDPERSREANVAHDAVEIRGGDVGGPERSRPGRHAAVCDARANGLDVRAGQRAAVHHHLEAVVVRWIVATRHHHARLRAEVLRGEVRHRRGYHPDVDDVGAGGADAIGNRGGELRPGEAAVATDDDRVAPALLRKRAQRLADRANDRWRQRLADDAADVVGLEDLGRKCHRVGRNGGCTGRCRCAITDGE